MPSVIDYSEIPFGARKISDHVNVRAAVTTSEQITVPTGANIVLLSGSLPFAVAIGANPTATYPAADIDDGTGNEVINPESPAKDRMFQVVAGQKIAVAAGSAAVVSAAFFKY